MIAPYLTGLWKGCPLGIWITLYFETVRRTFPGSLESKWKSRLTSVLHFAGATSIAFAHVCALLVDARREPCRQRRRTT